MMLALPLFSFTAVDAVSVKVQQRRKSRLYSSLKSKIPFRRSESHTKTQMPKADKILPKSTPPADCVPDRSCGESAPAAPKQARSSVLWCSCSCFFFLWPFGGSYKGNPGTYWSSSGIYSIKSSGWQSRSRQSISIFFQSTPWFVLNFWSVDWLNSFSFLIRFVLYPLSFKAAIISLLNCSGIISRLLLHYSQIIRSRLHEIKCNNAQKIALIFVQYVNRIARDIVL